MSETPSSNEMTAVAPEEHIPGGILPISSTLCPVCVQEGGRPGGICARCGATDADIRLLYHAAAKEYAKARENALASRFATARLHLKKATELGIANAPAVRELSQLLEAIDPPVKEQENVHYRLVRDFALQGKFTHQLPFLLPDSSIGRELKKLYGVGFELQHRKRWRAVLRYAMLTVVSLGAGFALFSWQNPTSIPENLATPTPRMPLEVPIKTIVVQSPSPSPSPLPYPYPERLTRRYYSDCLSAYREGKWEIAAHLADLAIETGKNSYLLPHALLKRAQIADTIGDGNASQYWANIARMAPDSAYAPLGLLRAAERVQKYTGDLSVMALYLHKLVHEYPLSEETRVAKRRYSLVQLPGNVHKVP